MLSFDFEHHLQYLSKIFLVISSQFCTFPKLPMFSISLVEGMSWQTSVLNTSANVVWILQTIMPSDVSETSTTSHLKNSNLSTQKSKAFNSSLVRLEMLLMQGVMKMKWTFVTEIPGIRRRTLKLSVKPQFRWESGWLNDVPTFLLVASYRHSTWLVMLPLWNRNVR